MSWLTESGTRSIARCCCWDGFSAAVAVGHVHVGLSRGAIALLTIDLKLFGAKLGLRA